MKTEQIIFLLFILMIISSCGNRKSVYFASKDEVWRDLDSLIDHSKGYRVFYLDSNWIKREVILIDSNFIKANLSRIDSSIIHNVYLNEQGFNYEFYFIDTLKKTNNYNSILILGKYKYSPDTFILNQLKLILLQTNGNKVISSFLIAYTRENSRENQIKTSVILPGMYIVSRTIYHHCIEICNKLNCSWSSLTEFKYYDQQIDRFVPYKMPVVKTVEYKIN